MATVSGAGPVASLVALPGVQEAVQQAREACDRLRSHPGLRHRREECRAEADVWAAWASARLEGVDLPVDLVRRAAGGGPLPGDAAGRTLAGALRAGAEVPQLADGGAAGLRAVPRALARLHLAAAAGLEDDADLGRPLQPGPQAAARLEGLNTLLGGGAPALVVAALLDAEISTAGFFRSGNEVVARAAARAAQVGLGLDPSGITVTEFGMLADPAARRQGLAAYATGRADGVRQWLLDWAGWVVLGAAHGTQVVESVATGRPLTM